MVYLYWFQLEPNHTMIVPNFLETVRGSVIYFIIISFIIFFGIAGNILVVLSVLINKHLRTVGNIFIVNLALADFSVSSLVDTFSVVGVLVGEAWFAHRAGLCEFIATMCLTSCFCSLLNIGAISFNRYIHICHHQLYQQIFTIRNSVLIAICLWIVSFLFEMPNFLGWGGHFYDPKEFICMYNRESSYTYNIFFVIIGVGTQLILISICYLLIYIHASASSKRVNASEATTGTAGGASGKEQRESMKLARTLFIIFVAFTVCWSPYAVIVLSDVYNTFPREAYIFSILLAHVNSCIDCILYGLTNKHFRKSYAKILGVEFCMNKYQEKYDKKKKAISASQGKPSQTGMPTSRSAMATQESSFGLSITASSVHYKNGASPAVAKKDVDSDSADA